MVEKDTYDSVIKLLEMQNVPNAFMSACEVLPISIFKLFYGDVGEKMLEGAPKNHDFVLFYLKTNGLYAWEATEIKALFTFDSNDDEDRGRASRDMVLYFVEETKKIRPLPA